MKKITLGLIIKGPFSISSSGRDEIHICGRFEEDSFISEIRKNYNIQDLFEDDEIMDYAEKLLNSKTVYKEYKSL